MGTKKIYHLNVEGTEELAQGQNLCTSVNNEQWGPRQEGKMGKGDVGKWRHNEGTRLKKRWRGEKRGTHDGMNIRVRNCSRDGKGTNLGRTGRLWHIGKSQGKKAITDRCASTDSER